MTDRRDQYICAALTGLLANSDTEGAMQDIATDAVNLADAALAAAGEKEAGTIQLGHTCTVCPVFQAEIARLKRQAEPLTQTEAVEAWNMWCTSGSSSTGIEGITERERIITAVKSRRV
jgi:hypothetical protein